MTRAQTMVQLTDDLRDELDRMARRRGVSRSSLIRTALHAYLSDDAESLVGQRIAEGYRRVPQSSPDEWGSPGKEADRAALETMQRLDAEERAAGHEPW